MEAQENLPYRLRVSSHSQVGGFVPYDFVDLNGDAIDEIISIAGPSPDYTIHFHRRPDELIQKFSFRGTLTANSTPLDIDNDGITKEYLISEQFGDRVALLALWPFENRTKELFSMTCPQPEVSGWECRLYTRDLIDVNRDGKPDLIVYFKTNAEPACGVIAIDLATGNKIWQREMACTIRGYVRVDLDQDGSPEILLATESLNSEARTDSTDDKHAYLMILDSHTGLFRHLQPCGGSFTKTYIYSPAEWGLPSSQFVLVVDAPQQSSHVEVWDWRLRRPVAQLTVPAMKWHFIADVNGDKKPELVFIDHTGSWQAIDVNLQRIAGFPTTLSFQHSVIVPSLPAYQIPLPIRLPGTSRPGIVAQFPNRAGFIVFDVRLQPAAIWDEGVAGELRRIRRGQQDELFWETTDHVYFLQLSRNSVFTLIFNRAGTWMMLALGAIAAGLALRSRLQHRKEFLISRMLQALQSLKIGAVVLQNCDRVVKGNSQFGEILNMGEHDLEKRRLDEICSAPQYADLLMLIKNRQDHDLTAPQRCELQQAQTQKEVEVMVVPVRTPLGRNRLAGWNRLIRWNRLMRWERLIRWTRLMRGERLDVLLVRDVTEQYAARRATFWAKTAQKLAHDLKTPLSSILMAVDHLQNQHGIEIPPNGQASDDYIGHIRSEVARVRKHAIGFMKLVDLEKPKFEPIAVNELVVAAASTFAPLFGDHIQLSQELEDNLPRIAGDAKQLRIVLNNLIDNAISAMPNGGTLTLHTYLVSPLPDSDGSSQEYAAIEIQDTGSGIPPEILEHIREQQLFVTTKPDGTGVGLVQVQEIISDHQGQFEINSTPGVGTMIYLAIPIYQEQ